MPQNIHPRISRQLSTCVAVCLTLVVTACSSSYRVVLNDNVVYTPTSSTPARPSLVNDANLQGCLNQQFASTGNDDPDSITLLACPAAGIESIAGISVLKNLEQLELSDNGISDLSPLRGMASLRVLSIRNNRINNISPIFSLPLLRFVALQGNTSINCSQLDTLQEKIGNTLNPPDTCKQ